MHPNACFEQAPEQGFCHFGRVGGRVVVDLVQVQADCVHDCLCAARHADAELLPLEKVLYSDVFH